MRHALRVKAVTRIKLPNWRALLDYLETDTAFSPVERFRVLYLDSRNGLIVEDIASGTIDAAPCYVREIIGRALQVGAASLILIHNHPSGDPAPSRTDIEVTRSLVAAAKLVGIAVLDHLIVGTQGHSSLRTLALM